MTKEDTILLRKLEDKQSQCESQYCLAFSNFLDVRQVGLAEQTFRNTKHIFYGGYDDAERRILMFLPDYLDEWAEEDDPLCVVRAETPKITRELTHRDYLGSLLGLGIDRSVTGDILVRPDGADIIVLKSMGDYIARQYSQVGRTAIKTTVLPIGEMQKGEITCREQWGTVASLRLDSMVGECFHLSRGDAQEAVRSGLVFLNNFQEEKADRPVKEGDKIVLRGKGKVVIKETGSETKKGRIPFVVTVYGGK